MSFRLAMHILLLVGSLYGLPPAVRFLFRYGPLVGSVGVVTALTLLWFSFAGAVKDFVKFLGESPTEVIGVTFLGLLGLVVFFYVLADKIGNWEAIDATSDGHKEVAPAIAAPASSIPAPALSRSASFGWRMPAAVIAFASAVILSWLGTSSPPSW